MKSRIIEGISPFFSIVVTALRNHYMKNLYLPAILILATILAWPAFGESPTILLSLQSDHQVLSVGESANITVTAMVEHPLDGSDGIFTFDLDLIIKNTSILTVTPDTVVRPGTDDLSFSGSNGTIASWGLNGIAGGYWASNCGIDIAQVLFTAKVYAIADGESALMLGPDTDFFGVDFVLNESRDMAVQYDQSVTIEVIPEPCTIVLLVAGICFIKRPRSRLI